MEVTMLNVGVIITGVIFLSLVAIIKITADTKLRQRLIEKDMVKEDIKYLYPAKSGNAPTSLRWGMVLIAIGLAFIIGQLVNEFYQTEVTIGSIFFLSGVALVIYYQLAKKNFNEKETK